MARLLRSNIQDFVQEVPVGNGSGYPLSVPAVAPKQHTTYFVYVLSAMVGMNDSAAR